MKRFYIAGRTKQIAFIQKIAQSLRDQGYTWSFDWTAQPLLIKPLRTDDPQADQFAIECIQGIAQADLFILLATDPLGASGMYVELGIALGSQNKQIWIIGDDDPSVFSCLKSVHHTKTIETFLQEGNWLV